MKKIYGAEPFYFNQEKKIIKNISNIISSKKLSSGKFVKRFEKKFSNLIKSKYSIAVNSGGTALEIALEALNIRGKDVLVPTQTFIATPNAIIRAGGNPIFCDIEKSTGCLDPIDVLKKITKKTVGIIFVPMFGVMPNSILKIKKICKKNNLFFMEDAAHAHGASFKNIHAGNIADISAFSFYATKIVTTAEGGMISTNNKKLNDKCLKLRNHGRSLKNNLFEMHGNNFRLSEIHASIGISQLSNIKKSLTHRNKLAEIYNQRLNNQNFFEKFIFDENSQNSFWRYPLYLNKKINRFQLQKNLAKKNIRITWMYEPLCHQQPIFRNKNKTKLPVAEEAIKRLINLPTHPSVSDNDANKICNLLISECNNLYND
jgi:perosamine synthetase